MMPSPARTVQVPPDGQPTLARLSSALAFPLHSPGDVLDYTLDFSSWLTAGDVLADAAVTTSADGAVRVGWVQRTDASVTALLAGGVVGAQIVSVAITTTQGLRKAVDVSLPVYGQAAAASIAPSIAPDQLLTSWGAPRLTTDGKPIIIS